MSETFTIRRQVEFNHCDPAGMVFYPRYFEMISALVERFFADVVDFSWIDMGALNGGMGTPTGNIEVRFRKPSRLGDWLDFSLSIERLGRSSATFAITCASGGETRFDCISTVVYANTYEGASAPWPDAVRDRMSRYMTSQDTKKEAL